MFLIVFNVQESQTQETFDCSIRHHTSHELAIIFSIMYMVQMLQPCFLLLNVKYVWLKQAYNLSET